MTNRTNAPVIRHWRAVVLLTGGWFLFCQGPLLAQSLQIQVSPATDGKEGSAVVSVAFPPGKEPLALQWDFVLPLPVLLDSKGVRAGEAAVQAEKSVRCEVLPNRQGKDQIYRCILAGGRSSIPNGPVAAVSYFAPKYAKPGRYELAVKKAFAVGTNIKKEPLKDTQAEISIAR